jgi:hypothetical protein
MHRYNVGNSSNVNAVEANRFFLTKPLLVLTFVVFGIDRVCVDV